MSAPDFKNLILSRFCGEFQPADKNTATVFKTSQDIVVDLRPIAEFTTNEVSAYLISMGYTLGFIGSEPRWLMTTEQPKELDK